MEIWWGNLTHFTITKYQIKATQRDNDIVWKEKIRFYGQSLVVCLSRVRILVDFTVLFGRLHYYALPTLLTRAFVHSPYSPQFLSSISLKQILMEKKYATRLVCYSCMYCEAHVCPHAWIHEKKKGAQQCINSCANSCAHMTYSSDCDCSVSRATQMKSLKIFHQCKQKLPVLYLFLHICTCFILFHIHRHRILAALPTH